MTLSHFLGVVIFCSIDFLGDLFSLALSVLFLFEFSTIIGVENGEKWKRKEECLCLEGATLTAHPHCLKFLIPSIAQICDLTIYCALLRFSSKAIRDF